MLLEGKRVSFLYKEQLKKEVDALLLNGKRRPHLAAILVGHDGASETYVNSKVKNCAEIGFTSTLLQLEENITEKDLLEKIKKFNDNEQIDGILVQLPLPKHINEQKVIEAIDPEKDVDGFHPLNAGKLVQGIPSFISATPYGIMLLLEYYQIETKGKNTVVIGRSNIVGRPMSILLSSNRPFGNSTVTLCHSQTKNLEEICLGADIIVAALGKPGFIHADMVKEGSVIIDVGITRVPDSTKKSGYRLQGDVDFENVFQKCSAITPVPGGVGLMTITGLLKNTMQAYLSKHS
ncbi:MAG: bifunctional 5,10-methylenetetrahydrofolate dehydrogenase/5,10-methenyltetrahydrofolate cyclohydrolase [Bacteroidetes bacterium]|nr:bifunctional 5,10-methylenetetrahydrofolate dehydrogenase/5,10-methenyltetrahydrofolate cyclohydrolase [Bacteroidota bacterium]